MNAYDEWIVEHHARRNAAKNVLLVSRRHARFAVFFHWLFASLSVLFDWTGNTEEEMEEYTEIFEHIEEYRADSKKSSAKKSTKNQKESSSSDDDDESDGDSTDTTTSNDESDASSEEEDASPAKTKKAQSSKQSSTSSTKKN